MVCLIAGDRDSISPEGCHKIASASPKPNKIVREPPDGCEKVKAFDENKLVQETRGVGLH